MLAFYGVKIVERPRAVLGRAENYKARCECCGWKKLR